MNEIIWGGWPMKIGEFEDEDKVRSSTLERSLPKYRIFLKGGTRWKYIMHYRTWTVLYCKNQKSRDSYFSGDIRHAKRKCWLLIKIGSHSYAARMWQNRWVDLGALKGTMHCLICSFQRLILFCKFSFVLLQVPTSISVVVLIFSYYSQRTRTIHCKPVTV